MYLCVCKGICLQYLLCTYLQVLLLLISSKCNCILTYNGSDEFTQCSVNINLAGYRDSLCCQTAVYITWYKTKLCLECRPAFSCNRNIFSDILCVPLIQSFNVISYCASFGRISGFLLPAPSSSSISFTIAGILSSPACLLNALKQDQVLNFLQSQHQDCISCLIGALHARKFSGRGPKLMIFKSLNADDSSCDWTEFMQSYLHTLLLFQLDTLEYML